MKSDISRTVKLTDRISIFVTGQIVGNGILKIEEIPGEVALLIANKYQMESFNNQSVVFVKDSNVVKFSGEQKHMLIIIVFVRWLAKIFGGGEMFRSTKMHDQTLEFVHQAKCLLVERTDEQLFASTLPQEEAYLAKLFVAIGAGFTAPEVIRQVMCHSDIFFRAIINELIKGSNKWFIAGSEQAA